MEKVYVLTEVTTNMGYEGYDKTVVVGVFASYEKLKEYMDNHPTRSWAYHDYEELEVIK